MLQREEVGRHIPDPCWRGFRTQEGLPFWGCSVTGGFRTEPPCPLPDTQGGLFCDEPVTHSPPPPPPSPPCASASPASPTTHQSFVAYPSRKEPTHGPGTAIASATVQGTPRKQTCVCSVDNRGMAAGKCVPSFRSPPPPLFPQNPVPRTAWGTCIQLRGERRIHMFLPVRARLASHRRKRWTPGRIMVCELRIN